MNILLTTGLDIIKFGENSKSAISKLGQPDKEWFDSNDSLNYAYYDNKIILTFEKELNDKLGWIVVENKSTTFESEDIWGLSKEEIILKYSNILKSKVTIDDFDSTEHVNFDDFWLEFQFSLGSLVAINFGVLFDENDNPIFKK